MTYFEKPDHSYHRMIFEFTDKEMKDAGFEHLSSIPGCFEILHVLQRIAENDKKQLDIPWKFSMTASPGMPSKANENEKSKETYLSELQETMKRFSREDHADLQRKKDLWKAKALRLIGFLNDKDKEVERLKDKYEMQGQKCGNEYVNNLPIKLWDCPVCTEKLRGKMKRFNEDNTLIRHLLIKGIHINDIKERIPWEEEVEQVLKDQL